MALDCLPQLEYGQLSTVGTDRPDLSVGHRGGVYFEAGYAMGRGLPVIWTCKRDDIDTLHFDVRQYNCIDWTAPGDLATRLQKRIEALLGRGPIA
jgi:hypothetical protein